jgi:hypothetical protein
LPQCSFSQPCLRLQPGAGTMKGSATRGFSHTPLRPPLRPARFRRLPSIIKFPYYYSFIIIVIGVSRWQKLR